VWRILVCVVYGFGFTRLVVPGANQGCNTTSGRTFEINGSSVPAPTDLEIRFVRFCFFTDISLLRTMRRFFSVLLRISEVVASRLPVIAIAVLQLKACCR
jgi:hypothetical protein